VSSCLRCQHIFQTDLAVTVSYDANYARQYDLRPVREMSDLRWDFIQSRLHLPARSRVLDVGYGNGAFLKRARAAGMTIFGIDLHTEDFGIPVVEFDAPQDYDLVCFFDSLEHFPDFAPILRLNTRFAIVSIPQTPDFMLAAPRKWRHFKPGEHLHYFSTNSLDTFMRSWGFTGRLAEGNPEDNLRGKLAIDGKSYDNIYTAIYVRA
jgi:SAM-dependent methyltransferase